MGIWDPTDKKYEWSIEKEIDEMITRGRLRAYDRLFKGSVENVNLHSDGTADIDIFGKDDSDKTGHWHFNVAFNERGEITSVKNCHRR